MELEGIVQGKQGTLRVVEDGESYYTDRLDGRGGSRLSI